MMKKILYLLFLLPFLASAQNTTTLESGTAPFTPQFHYKAITPDSLNHWWMFNTGTGKYNRLVTMTEANLLYAPITGGSYVSSVLGTTNRITVSPTTGIPVIDISSTFESLLLKKANNLSDVASASTSRTNIGLGSGSDVTFRTISFSLLGHAPSAVEYLTIDGATIKYRTNAEVLSDIGALSINGANANQDVNIHNYLYKTNKGYLTDTTDASGNQFYYENNKTDFLTEYFKSGNYDSELYIWHDGGLISNSQTSGGITRSYNMNIQNNRMALDFTKSGKTSYLAIDSAGKVTIRDSLNMRGLVGYGYYGANYTDNTYVQKKYVVDNFAPITGGAYLTALTGDVLASGSGSVVATLATVNASPATYGSATQTPVFVVNNKGLVTSVTNTTITPAIGSITGLGTGVATALGVNTGSPGAPVLFNGAGGTPSSMIGTFITGTAAGLTAGNVTTNANLTGIIISVGNATSITSQTGTGTTFAMSVDPTFTGTVTTGTVVTNDANHTIASHGASGIVRSLIFTKSRNTLASPTAVVSGDAVGNIAFQGYDGTSNVNSASIKGAVDNTVSTGVVPGIIQFITNSATGVATVAGAVNSQQHWLLGSGADNGLGAKLQTVGLATITKMYSGTAGTDSIMVHGSDGKLKVIAPSAFATNPLTTTGDIIYSSSGSTAARRGIGSTNNVLMVSGGVPTWVDLFGTVNSWNGQQLFAGGAESGQYRVTNVLSAWKGDLISDSLSNGTQWTLPNKTGRIALTSDIGIHGNSTTTGTATTSVVVTIGTTQANTNYFVTITPQDLLTAVNYYISAKTTTTFTVTFVTALTGSINFDWALTP